MTTDAIQILLKHAEKIGVTIDERSLKFIERMATGENVCVFGGRWSGKSLVLKAMALAAAANNGGRINVCRYDRDEKKLVMDEITWDMPLDEIVV